MVRYLGTGERDINKQTVAMWTVYQSVVMKRELSIKAKLSIYQLIYVPTLTYPHERMRSRKQLAKGGCPHP